MGPGRDVVERSKGGPVVNPLSHTLSVISGLVHSLGLTDSYTRGHTSPTWIQRNVYK